MKKLWYTPNLQLFGGDGAEGTVGETGARDAVAGQNGADSVDLENEFSQLINGKFKDQFTRKTQAIIDKRFKETKTLEAYRERVSPAVQKLMEKYGVEEGDEGRLAELIGNEEEINENTEDERALDSEEWENDEDSDFDSEDSEDEEEEFDSDSDDFVDEDAIFRRHVMLRERVSSWVKQGETLKQLYPDFDLRKELRHSPLFSQLVMGGAPIKAAYETVHHNEILGGAMAYTAGKVREQVVKNIETKGRRPLENGISSEAAVVTSVDVNSLTSKDILKIIKQVENGANIKF